MYLQVLLKRDGARTIAKVADFGLSVQIDRQATHVSEFLGTVTHMSPGEWLGGLGWSGVAEGVSLFRAVCAD